MPVRESTPQGAPCWIDLMSSNPEKSKEFYTALFGWEAETSGEEYGNYVMFRKNGRPVAGMGKNQEGSGYPDVWSTYLASDDINGTVKAVTEAGGQILMEPMQVGTEGSMAIFADPSGAAIGSWQSADHKGFELVGEEGAPAWFELCTLDYDAAVPFYATAFDWNTEVMSDTAEFRYTLNGPMDESTAGIFDAKGSVPESVPSHWQVYLGVKDTDAAVARAQELGATVLRPAWDSPYGRMAQLADPTGAAFMISSV